MQLIAHVFLEYTRLRMRKCGCGAFLNLFGSACLRGGVRGVQKYCRKLMLLR